MDIKLYYQEKGKGIPLVLLHGNGENGDYFKNQINYFSKNYRVIAPDTRGHGKTKRGTKPFTMSQFADDLNDFLEQMNIEKIILLGFSDGANIAMKFALKYQDKIKALILNGGNLDTKGVKKIAQIPIEIGYKFIKLFQNKSEELKIKTEILGLMVNEPNIKVEELKKIKVPTLVIAGTKDLIKKNHTKLIADNIKNSKLTFIKGNHFIVYNKSEKFNEEVEKFLKNI